jgi:hypothetical protein
MPNYLLAYHGGGMAPTEEEQTKQMAAWGEWFQGLGDKLVDGGLPIQKTALVENDGSVNNNGGVANPVSGYSVVKAENLDAALEVAKKCPVLMAGASIEVGETMDMGM